MLKAAKEYFIGEDVTPQDKANRIFLLLIRLSLFGAIIFALFSERWLVFFVSFFTLILTFIPRIFEETYKIDLPVEFEVITVLFIYGSLFLGEVHGYYTRFWWWDLALHTGSAIAFGFIGFTVLYILYKTEKIEGSALIIALFSFFFAIGIGALWEIFEFTVDVTFGLNLQKSGLLDTMSDLIVDSIGALIASVSGYLYLKNGDLPVLNRIMKRFEKNNPRLFDKNKK